jgi:hypothetical protein
VGGEWSRPRLGPFNAGKQNWYQLYSWMGPRAGYVQVRKVSPLTGNGSPDLPPRSESDIEMNAFYKVWKEAALGGIFGATPRFVWASWEEPEIISYQTVCKPVFEHVVSGLRIRRGTQKSATFTDCTCTRIFRAKDLWSVWGHLHVDFRIISAKICKEWRRYRRNN